MADIISRRKRLSYQRRKPILTFIHERETLIPRRKLVDIIGINPFGGHHRLTDYFTEMLVKEQPPPPALIDRIRPEDAIEVIAASSWAKGLAEGVCGPGYVGLVPGTAEYDRCVYTVSHRVAAKVAPRVIPPAPPVVPPRRPPRRR